MRLSSEEVRQKVYEVVRAFEEGERQREAFGGAGSLVQRDERAAEAEGDCCTACGRKWGAVELHPEVGWVAQWRADRALWLAAEPIPYEEVSGEDGEEAGPYGHVPQD